MFSKLYLMVLKNKIVKSLDGFAATHSINDRLITDVDATVGTSKAWKHKMSTYKIQQRWTQPHSLRQNQAELDVCEAKREIQRFMKRTKSPKQLWCYCGELVTASRSHTAYDSPLLRGRSAVESVIGYTPDISLCIQHSWYDPI